MKPDIYYFNPTCELAVANNSTNYMASANLRRFENELNTLPGILAHPEDLVLVNNKPPQQFADHLECAGFHPPAFQTIENLVADSEFMIAKKGFLFPWGWSPATHKLLSPFKSGCSPEFLKSPVAEWRNIHRELYSRKTSLTILKLITTKNSLCNILSINELPDICTSHEQIIALQRKWGIVVVKAPWSASGRGLHILRPNEYNQTNRQVVAGFLKQQGYVIAGPWHDRVIDLSFQFFSRGNSKLEYRGLTTFTTDQTGHYMGNYIQELPPDLEPELEEFIQENLPPVIKTLLQILNESNYSSDYTGWLGVDALVFRSTDGMLKIHPCLEINCRFTMGAIAINLRDHLSDRSVGEFRIMHGKVGQFMEFSHEMMKKEQLILDNGKIVSGFLPLTPPRADYSFGAYLNIINKGKKEGTKNVKCQ